MKTETTKKWKEIVRKKLGGEIIPRAEWPDQLESDLIEENIFPRWEGDVLTFRGAEVLYVKIDDSTWMFTEGYAPLWRAPDPYHEYCLQEGTGHTHALCLSGLSGGDDELELEKELRKLGFRVCLEPDGF